MTGLASVASAILGAAQVQAEAEGPAAAAEHAPAALELWYEQHTILYPIATGLRELSTAILSSVGLPHDKAADLSAMLLQPFVISTWFLCIALIVLALVVRKRLEFIPRRNLAGLMELIVDTLRDFARGAIGPGGEAHAPFIATLFLFIVTANWIGLVPGFLSPIGVTSGDALTGLNTTFALALIAIVYVHYVAIRKRGLKSYLLHFAGEPLWLAPLNVPIHIIGELARPLSLAFRLFGNIGGEDKVLHYLAILLFLAAVPLHVPMTLFGVFTGILQAYVFTALTCAYIAGFLEHDDEEHGQQAHGEPRPAHS